MEAFAQSYVKFLLGVAIGGLLIWIGVTGRLGSLLGAFITPGYMVEGIPTNPDGSNANGQDFGGTQKFPGAVPKGTILNPNDIAYYAYQAGFRGNARTLAVAIALAESQGDPNAINPLNNQDYGLWQVNIKAHPEYSPQRLLEPLYNAQAAYTISSSGSNWNPWTTYKDGTYQQYMAKAQAATVQGQF